MISPSTFLHFLLLYYSIVRDVDSDSVRESSFDRSADPRSINVDDNGETTTEIHHATCKITTEKLSADAQAKFTRVLTGGCSAKAIEERFEKLERRFNERFDEIRDLTRLIGADPAGSKRPQTFHAPESEDAKNNALKAAYTRPSVIRQHYSGNRLDYAEVDSREERKRLDSTRRDEIERWNNTVHDEDGRNRVYTYYWRVSNLSEKLLEWETGRSERSPSFYVGEAGYAMYLRFAPKYFPDGTIFISAGLTGGSNDSDIAWPFPLQIRIAILDVATRAEANGSPIDRISRLWDPATVCSSYFWGRPRSRLIDGPGGQGGSAGAGRRDNPECVGLSIPRQNLETFGAERATPSFSSPSATSSSTFSPARRYISNDSILVKLTVYLL